LVETIIYDKGYATVSCLVVEQFMENRFFVEQLKQCEIAPALRKYRKYRSCVNEENNVAAIERIDRILSVLAESI